MAESANGVGNSNNIGMSSGAAASSGPGANSNSGVVNSGSPNAMKSDMEDKSGDYVRELLQEKQTLEQAHHSNTIRLVDQEVSRVQSGGKPPTKDSKYVDIYREKPIRVTAKVLVPVKEHPKFNFVGKLLGPKGNSMKRLQEETMTKMAVLGRGSMRDKQKEEELRASLDPKYQHLNDELHVEITAYAPPAEAHARIAYALAEVRKYLIPDNNDEIRQEQMREMELLQNGEPNGNSAPARRPGAPLLGMRGVVRGGGRGVAPPPMRGAMRGIPRGRGGLLAPPQAARGGLPPVRKVPPPPPPPPPPQALLPRPTPTKQKVLSILDRARVAMEESYGYEEENYYDSYDSYDTTGYNYEDYEEGAGEYYDSSGGFRDATGGQWKTFKAPGVMDRARFRPVPYARPK